MNDEWVGDEGGGGIMKKDVMLGGYTRATASLSNTNNTNDDEDDVRSTSAAEAAVIASSNSESSEEASSDENAKSKFKVVRIKNGKDVDSIPITKEGMAVCEKCGAIGVKHAFYSKSKRFCSLLCSRSYFDMQREGKPIPKPKPVYKVSYDACSTA